LNLTSIYDEAEEQILCRGYQGLPLDIPEIDPPPATVPDLMISAINVYAEEAVKSEACEAGGPYAAVSSLYSVPDSEVLMGKLSRQAPCTWKSIPDLARQALQVSMEIAKAKGSTCSQH
jgi:hypothetical protein